MDAKSRADFINSVKDTGSKAPAFKSTEEKTEKNKSSAEYTEEKSALAEGLPQWSLEPPNIMVRRR